MRGIVPVVALLGCGGGGGGPTIDISAPGAVLVAARDGAGDWEQVELDADGAGKAEVAADFYGIAVLCSDGDLANFDVRYVAERISPWVHDCDAALATTVSLSGSAGRGARVFVGKTEALVDDRGMYQTQVVPGTYDVVARGSRLLIERSVEVTADQVLDLAIQTDGVAMSNTTPTVVGATGPVLAYSDLTTAGGTYARLDNDASTVEVAPGSALIEGDRPSVGATAGECSAQEPLAEGVTPTVTLPQGFTATVSRDAVTWQAQWPRGWDEAAANLSAVGTPIVFADHRASADWLAAIGGGDALPVIDASALPGWEVGMPAIAAGSSVRYTARVSGGDPTAAYDACSTSGIMTW